jgi:hypothetical protein
MKPEIKARWLAALRSGNYRQAKYRLREGNDFCCLGVLCDILSPDIGGEWVKPKEKETAWPVTEHSFQFRCRTDHQNTEDVGGLLHERVAEVAGLDTNQLGVSFKPHLTLADLNDQGKSFAQIADTIEKYL